jgi:hypothetical protein
MDENFLVVFYNENTNLLLFFHNKCYEKLNFQQFILSFVTINKIDENLRDDISKIQP